MPIDYGPWRFWFDIFQFGFSCVLGVYVWISTRHRVTRERIKELAISVDGELKAHNNRLTKLETEIDFLPGQKDISELSDKISALTEKIGKLDGRLSGINRAVDLLNQHHIDRSDR